LALTVPQIEAHLGRFLRLMITHMDQDVAQRVLEPLATGMVSAGVRYVQNGNLGTQPERREAMMAMAAAIYNALGLGDAADGARGQHGFEAHWLPSKQRGEA